MRILYLLFSFTTGGTERLIADICNEMIKQNEQVYLYIINNLYSDSLLKALDKGVNVHLQKRPAGKGQRGKTIWDITKYIIKNKIDVIHCNSFNTPELLLLHGIAFKKTKIIYTIHGMEQFQVLNKVKVLYRNLICDKYITVSESVRRDIIKYGAKAEKIVTVYNAIDFRKFHKEEAKCFDKNNIVVGNAARIDPKIKGQDVLIKAIALIKNKYPGIKCIFAGEADKKHQQDYRELVELSKRLGIERNIVFLGNVEDIRDFLKQIDIFVLPSNHEGFGISLIEAMAMGIPCIASNINGPAEIIGRDSYGILFKSRNEAALSNSIQEIIENYSRYYSRAQLNIKELYSRYDLKVMCSKLKDCYKE